MGIVKNIILTGFMGCGKTTVGKLLAERLGRPFIDTDALIEEKAGMSVVEIFAQKGEREFRRMERDVAAELAAKEGIIIATGGRMLLDSANAVVLGESGVIICLTASPEEILRRVRGDMGHCRPLLDVADPGARIAELLQEREAGYSQFPEVITDGWEVEKVVEAVLLAVNSHG